MPLRLGHTRSPHEVRGWAGSSGVEGLTCQYPHLGKLTSWRGPSVAFSRLIVNLGGNGFAPLLSYSKSSVSRAYFIFIPFSARIERRLGIPTQPTKDNLTFECESLYCDVLLPYGLVGATLES